MQLAEVHDGRHCLLLRGQHCACHCRRGATSAAADCGRAVLHVLA
jgi:hypothetical protein